MIGLRVHHPPFDTLNAAMSRRDEGDVGCDECARRVNRNGPTLERERLADI